jgi:ABC-type multidrug transport system fused ATPase/permease subunit
MHCEFTFTIISVLLYVNMPQSVSGTMAATAESGRRRLAPALSLSPTPTSASAPAPAPAPTPVQGPDVITDYAQLYADRQETGWCDQLLFTWLTPLIEAARVQPLQDYDILSTNKFMHSYNSWAKFRDEYGSESDQGSCNTNSSSSHSSSSSSSSLSSFSSDSSLLHKFLWYNRLPLVLSGILFLLYAFTQLATPLLIKALIQYLEDRVAADSTSTSSESADSDTIPSPYTGYVIAFWLVFVSIAGQLAKVSSMQSALEMCFSMQSALMYQVHEKLLRIRQSDRDSMQGQSTNLLSTDCQKILDYPSGIHTIWISPLLIILGTYLMVQQVGYAALAGIGVMIAFMPVGASVTWQMIKAQQHLTTASDKRIGLTDSVINGFKIVKYSGWEAPFTECIMRNRDSEVEHLTTYGMLKGFSFSIYTFVPFFAGVATFLAFALSGGTLTASRVFTTIALINVIKFPFSFFPLALNYWVQVIVAFRRLETFFSLAEVDDKPHTAAISHTANDHDLVIQLCNASFEWSNIPGAGSILQRVSIQAPQHSLTAVVGGVATGKSSLLSALCGELYTIPGVHAASIPTGVIAYSPQEAFMINDTIRNNILFGTPLDLPWYHQVLQACGLLEDLKQLDDGDSTQVRLGMNLSGGQKQRICLARCVYRRDAELVLLDDPLSAIDPELSELIFQQCMRGILATKTCVLVTSSVQLAQKCDSIVMMDNMDAEARMFDIRSRLRSTVPCSSADSGDMKLMEKESDGVLILDSQQQQKKKKSQCCTVVAQEHTAAESKHSVFRALWNAHTRTSSQCPPSAVTIAASAAATAGTEDGSDTSFNDSDEKVLQDTQSSMHIQNDDTVSQYHDQNSDKTVHTTIATPQVHQHVSNGKVELEPEPESESESDSFGRVGIHIYKAYIQAAASNHKWWLLLLLCTVLQLSDFWGTWWLGYWSDKVEHDPDQNQSIFMLVYALSVSAAAIVVCLRSYMIVKFGISASQELHDSMLQSVLWKPLSYFVSNPPGRLMNRFSKDLFEIDSQLPLILEYALGSHFAVVGVILIVIIALPAASVLLLPMMYAFVRIQLGFIGAARDLQRLSASTRSPVLARASETSAGVSVIRAFQTQEMFTKRFMTQLDRHLDVLYVAKTAESWLQARLAIVSGCLMTVVCFGIVLADQIDVSRPSVTIASLLLTQCMVFTYYLGWAVKTSTNLEGKMSACERILHVGCNGSNIALVSNAAATVEAEGEREGGPGTNADDHCISVNIVSEPEQDWPSQGKIEFRNVSARYAPHLRDVLTNVTFDIPAGSRTAIVGRTGSGKSTLVTALLQLIPLADQSSIIVDGIDIQSVRASTLRRRIAIIPQDPIVFNTTLRQNVDPFEEFTDEQVRHALELTQLAELAELANHRGMDIPVADLPQLKSQGTCQLLCLARALLRRPAIICLDEATASLDVATDERMQAIIRDHFSDCTVVTVAHRINTILDYDQVIVLDNGTVMDIGVPTEVLAKLSFPK